MTVSRSNPACLLLLPLLAACSDPSARSLDHLVLVDGVYLDAETMAPYTGPVTQAFPGDSSRVKTSGAMRDGRMHGPWKEYYESGRLRTSYAYSEGALDGQVVGFFDDGTPWLERTYVSGRAEGTWRQYHQNGQLRTLATYADGRPHGPMEVYYDDGRLRLRGAYHAGEPCGPWTASGRDLGYPDCPTP